MILYLCIFYRKIGGGGLEISLVHVIVNPFARKCEVLMVDHSYYWYSIICLFRIALGADEKFGLDRVRITESIMFRLTD